MGTSVLSFHVAQACFCSLLVPAVVDCNLAILTLVLHKMVQFGMKQQSAALLLLPPPHSSPPVAANLVDDNTISLVICGKKLFLFSCQLAVLFLQYMVMDGHDKGGGGTKGGRGGSRGSSVEGQGGGMTGTNA